MRGRGASPTSQSRAHTPGSLAGGRSSPGIAARAKNTKAAGSPDNAKHTRHPTCGARKHPTAEALKQAQEHVAAQAKWSHPYYWAAWQLWGLPD